MVPPSPITVYPGMNFKKLGFGVFSVLMKRERSETERGVNLSLDLMSIDWRGGVNLAGFLIIIKWGFLNSSSG